ncbi:hypothetical protein FV228_03235 [Methylobacterium sp. WL18]|uniref:hypothetical protein n=1 Tax=Methylobacterium sp. WL18 TaxID=2603897 RepID=UPI0011C7F71F|nr:hypothetical protein [Methylobacterium sp. WL18]TXN75629.1 hypothetical protein FV228_03235 [Methylobacterium sp. WL18]
MGKAKRGRRSALRFMGKLYHYPSFSMPDRGLSLGVAVFDGKLPERFGLVDRADPARLPH